MTDAIVEVEHLVAGYSGRTILKDLSLQIRRGRITAVVGPSGCGKSTLFKCIVGLLRPFSGSVRVNGQDLTALSEDRLPEALSRVGLLFQQGALLNSVPVRENVALPLREHSWLPEAVIQDIVVLKLQAVGLAHAADLLPAELSGGMRKRAALARAMALDPELLLCDEPSAGLDPPTAADLDALILRLKETFQMTVVVVTHEIPSIEAIADDVIFLGRGGVLQFQGTQQDARAFGKPEVRDFFARRPGTRDEGTCSLLDLLAQECES